MVLDTGGGENNPGVVRGEWTELLHPETALLDAGVEHCILGPT